MLNIAVCDDNIQHAYYAASHIRAMLAPEPTEIITFNNPSKFCLEVKTGHCIPDIAVLDIDMNDMDGIDLAKCINIALPNCQIIFLTNYIDFAQDVYSSEHIGFVLKKDLDTRLKPALIRAINASRKSRCSLPVLFIKTKNSTFSFPIKDTFYLERVGRKTRIITESDDIWTSQRPDDLLLNQPSDIFIHCHQGYWVNSEKIIGMEGNEFFLSNNQRIPISRTFKAESKKLFLKKFLEK